MKYFIGIDLGGTNIAAGVVDEQYHILAKASTPTSCPRAAELIADDMAAMAKKAISEAGLTMEDIQWIGVGSPGSVNRATGMIDYAGNLGFFNVPMRQYIEERLGKPVCLDNDANAAALGETLAGAARGAKYAVVVTLGTGIGSGIIVDSKVYSGFNFAGGELGHISIEMDGKLCTCGRRGCFETYASATGLINLTKDKMKEHPDSAMWEICGGDLAKVNGKTAFDGLRLGDNGAIQTVNLYIRYLAGGLTSIINVLQPEVLCIGGGVCKEGDTLLTPVKKLIAEEVFTKRSENNTRIVIAQLGNDAGIIGAAMLCK